LNSNRQANGEKKTVNKVANTNKKPANTNTAYENSKLSKSGTTTNYIANNINNFNNSNSSTNNNNNSNHITNSSNSNASSNANKNCDIKTEQLQSFEHIESSINTQLMKLKMEKKNFNNSSDLKPLITLRNYNSLYVNEQLSLNNSKSEPRSPTNSPPLSNSSNGSTSNSDQNFINKNNNNNNNNNNINNNSLNSCISNPIHISYTNLTMSKLDELNVHTENPFLVNNSNPSTVYRLQKLLNVPKTREESGKSYSLKACNLKLNEIPSLPIELITANNTKNSPSTRYRLTKPEKPKPETYYNPATSYTQDKKTTKTVRTSVSEASASDNDCDTLDATGDNKKIAEIEKIRHKLREEYNNLLDSRGSQRPKSAVICNTPNTLQYLKTTINKCNDLDTAAIQDELKVISLNKHCNQRTRPSSAATSKSKIVNANQLRNNKPRNPAATRPHYIDCESDDLTAELDRSVCQFKYDSTSNLMINSTQMPFQKTVFTRDSKQAYCHTNTLEMNELRKDYQMKNVFVSNPLKNNFNQHSKSPIENILNGLTANKQASSICINGKSMSTTSAVEFSSNNLENSVIFF